MYSPRKTYLSLALMAVTGLAALAPARAVTALFTFDADTTKTTTFTDTNNGVSATFSSPAVANGYTVGLQGFYAPPIMGNMLFTTNNSAMASPQANVLNILFSQPITSFFFNFATDDFGTPSPTSFTALSGGASGTVVYTTSVTGSVPTGYNFPQGAFNFSSSIPFNDVRLSSPSPAIVVDNIQVSTSAVPEAGPLPLLALGLAGLGLPLLRARKRTPA